MRFSVRVSPITMKPAKVRMFMPNRISLVSIPPCRGMGNRAWIEDRSRGSATSFRKAAGTSSVTWGRPRDRPHELASPSILSETQSPKHPFADQVTMFRHQAATVRLCGGAPVPTTISQKPSGLWAIFPSFSRRFNAISVPSWR